MVAALVVPGLILRDTGVLTISQRDLEGLTPTAADEIKQRQVFSRDAGQAAPYLFGFLLVGGAILIALGIPRLKRQEESAERRDAMELDKLHREMSPQTVLEREEQLRAEVEEKAESDDAAAAPKAPASPTGPAPGGVSRGSILATQLQTWAKAEADVLERLAEIAPPHYELQSQVKLEGPPSLLLDALFISRNPHLPDIVVEIKFGGKNLARNFRNRMMEAESQLLRYLSRYRRSSVGWLIIYATEEPTAKWKADIAAREAELPEVLKISVVTPDSLASLGLPVES